MSTNHQPAGPAPRRRGSLRKKLLIAVAAVAGFIIVISVIASVASPGKPSGHPAAAASATRHATPNPTPAPTPHPAGTSTGSCDYDLGSDPVGGTTVAIGEIDVTNTGNVGIVVRTVITWPQEGYPPLAMHQRIKVPVGDTRPASFHRPLSYDQITRLQAWQTGHNYADGCTYTATIVSNYGPVR
jgi:hypothetical protein